MAEPTLDDLAARLAVVEAAVDLLVAQSQQLMQDPKMRRVVTTSPEQLATLMAAHATEVAQLQARIDALQAQIAQG